ncbi:MAG: DNA polymerase Y family protein, partial [Pseudomonadota bacterium]
MAASRPVTRLPAVQAGEPLPLPFEAIDSSPSTPTMSPVLPAARATAPRRWLAVALPELVLESHIDPSQRAVEAAIIAEESGQLSVRAMTPAAAEQGVADGMTLAAAMALVPGLRLYTFFPDRVVQCRNALLQMALTFTPTVVCHRADVLLLEIGASRRLFGGFDRLLALLAHELQQRSHDFATAMAPTPRAAAWLAHSRPGAVVDDTDQLDAALRDVSLSALGWPDDVLRRLAAMGVRSLGDCRRLPRTGFAKRFGPARLLELDRAYGQSADPQQAYQPDEPFVARLELTAEIANKARLVGMAAILLERLARFARRRQRCVRALRFTFYAIDAPATVRVIRPGVLAQEIGHWQRLLELDLEPVDFAAPTILIELTVSAFEPLRARNGALPLS